MSLIHYRRIFCPSDYPFKCLFKLLFSTYNLVAPFVLINFSVGFKIAHSRLNYANFRAISTRKQIMQVTFAIGESGSPSRNTFRRDLCLDSTRRHVVP